SSIRRSGAPSRFSSDDIAAGSQYSRISPPMTVPGPTRTRSSLSLRFMLFALPKRVRIYLPLRPWGRRGVSLRPVRKAQSGPGAGRRAIARLVERPFEREMLDRTGDGDPVADF